MTNEYQWKKNDREISRNIPDEVLFEEILVRLPVKSLTVYKSVCKTWLYTIESNSFKEAHRCRHICDYSNQIMFSPYKSFSYPDTKSLSLLPSTLSSVPGLMEMTLRPLEVMLPSEMTQLDWPDSEVDFVSLSYMLSVSVLGPIRKTGIYCIVTSMVQGLFPSPFSAKISICNPATREYKLANPFPSDETERLTTRHICHVNYGFGVAADGDYKVVVVMNWGKKFSSFLSYVYSMKQGAWKKIVDSENAMVSRLDLRGKPYYPEITNDCSELCPQVFLNGCWHWMAMFSDGTCNIFSFDVDNEVFKLVLGPPSYRGNRRSEYASSQKTTSEVVSVLNDHLTVLYDTRHVLADLSHAISVWMMMENGDEESWINVWTVNLQSCPIMTLVGIAYSLREDGNGGIQIARVLFQDCSKQLVCCDESGEVQCQPDFDTSSCIFWNNLGISAYSETLERL